MTHVTIDQATKLYGETRALDDVCLAIAAGEFVTLLGPSGCGKSTTLRAVAGLLQIDRGAIAIDGRDVTHVPIHRRNIGMVFQNLALFPHMTVAENVAFGLRMRGIARAERIRRASEALGLVRLPGFEGRYPHQLSGGQQQRVAIARALVINPGVLLLDEPFAALDRKLREEMQMELRHLTRRLGITAMFVTHDQEEALTLSDRIVVMNAGRIEQTGVPDAIYSRPETRFVADFMGARNIFETRIVERVAHHLVLDWQGLRLRAPALHQQWQTPGQAIAVALRPELIRITAPAEPRENAIAGEVTARIDQGAFLTLTVEPKVPSAAPIIVRQTKTDQARLGTREVGDAVTLEWSVGDLVPLRDAPRAQAGTGIIPSDTEEASQTRRIA